MSAKQDRVAARTATDLERKYKFGESFGEVFGLVDEAQKAADEAEAAAKEASNAVNNLNDSLDHDEIFNRLTKDGEVMGIYRENGQIYINASYIMAGILNADFVKTGVLASADGTVKVDLINNEVIIESPSTNGTRKMVLSSSGINGYREDATTGELTKTLNIMPGLKYSSGAVSPSQIVSYGDVGLSIGTTYGDGGAIWIGDEYSRTNVNGRTVEILDKEVWWEANGDGSYTLKGR